jgi:anti-sigma regulatory factor (Ser/Thr protein kinase)/Na+-translocating ferredoxin:NAD+ oxidoreductase RNF subunit RnfB
MEHLAYDIQSGDFGRAGAASRDLKQHLKRIGAESNAVRRAMIAAYEAEMNVVIHTEGGRLEATVSDGQLDVDVIDRGPGIPDVPQAMREGFSTASSEARALGFGAGMGLPNIERNSDRLRVTSAVGDGTRVSFSIMLRPEAADQGARPSSLGIAAELCRDCRHCLVACPTAAVRVRAAQPSVLHHLCIDCTCCIAACDPGALTLLDAPDGLAPGADGVLAVPPALLSSFGDHAVDTVLEELRGLGFAAIVSVHSYEDELRRSVLDLAATAALPTPVISPVCPAVVSLIEVKFPSLTPHLAPLASPWEALQRDLGERDVTYVVSCPSQRTALLAQQPTAQRHTVTPRLVREALLPRLAARRRVAPGTPQPQPQAAGADDLLVVSGVSHVLAVLEQIEDGRLDDVASVEPFICDDGCFGSPLLGEDAFVAAWRWAAAAGAAPGTGRSCDRAHPYRPRPGIRLDSDMAVAIRKLAALDAATKGLPGKDCGVCGAPTCAALAEDVVMGRAARALCPYATPEEESAS